MKSPNAHFPDPRNAPADAPLAIGGNLDVATLLSAYTKGIFPWFSEGAPILWWCPDPRFVLEPDKFHIPHSLERRLQEPWQITADHAFSQVIEGCAQRKRPGQDGTWITRSMKAAYEELHECGYAHSIEVWGEKRLIGGLYGVAIGQAYFGESMFYLEPDASKVALASLVFFLRKKGYRLLDCQQPTEHLARFGAECWPRDNFLDELETALTGPFKPGKWSHETFSTRAVEHP